MVEQTERQIQSQVKINKMESLGVTRRSKSEQTSNLELERRLDRLELEQEGRYSVSFGHTQREIFKLRFSLFHPRLWSGSYDIDNSFLNTV